MGAQARAKADRRGERRVRAELERAGVADRVRLAYLGLKREDVQQKIRLINSPEAPWADQVALDESARRAMEHYGYDLTGVAITARMLKGRFVIEADGSVTQTPPRVVFEADVAPEALAEAERAARHKVNFKRPALAAS